MGGGGGAGVGGAVWEVASMRALVLVAAVGVWNFCICISYHFMSPARSACVLPGSACVASAVAVHWHQRLLDAASRAAGAARGAFQHRQ